MIRLMLNKKFYTQYKGTLSPTVFAGDISSLYETIQKAHEKYDEDINQNTNINPKYNLNEEQKNALNFLNFNNNKFDVSVLQGTTGSGKTLVYFSRLKKIIEKKINGILKTDTLDHTVSDFKFINQDGDSISNNTFLPLLNLSITGVLVVP